MRREAFLFYLLLVVNLAFSAELNVSSGYTYEVNVLVQKPLQNTSWLGIYGFLSSTHSKHSWTYYLGPFAQITNLSPTNEVREVELNLLDTTKTLAYPDYNEDDWYVVLSQSTDVNLYDLNSTCEKNVDALIDGNFCSECLPSETYKKNTFILVNDRNLCAREVNLYDGILSYLLEWNGRPVYLTPLHDFTLDGNAYNFAFLVSADGNDFYLYLTRKSIYCGDGVCDPGEEGNCSDCVSLTISVSPTSQEINVNGTAEYNVLLKNTGSNDLTVNLSLRLVAGDENGYTYDLAATTTTVASNSEKLLRLVIGASKAGVYTFQVIGTVGSVEVPSNNFQLKVLSPPSTEQNQQTPPSIGGAGTPPEQNQEITPTKEKNIVITPRGYYIPWLGCISYLHVFSPDSITLYLNEEKNVPVVIQNAGTCDEEINFFILGVDSNFYVIPETSFPLKKHQSRTIDITFKGVKPGVYDVTFVAKGYYESRRKMTLIVKGEAKETRHCKSNVLLMAPDVVELVEGEEFNTVLEVDNEGTCIEDVEITLTKKVGGATVIIDRRSLKLPPGERFFYKPPRLAAGEYNLHATAGGMEKDVMIIVKPKSAVTGVVTEIILQARLAILVILLLVVLGAVSYIRSRYLS